MEYCASESVTLEQNYAKNSLDTLSDKLIPYEILIHLINSFDKVSYDFLAYV